jgi:hypothetical protein
MLGERVNPNIEAFSAEWTTSRNAVAPPDQPFSVTPAGGTSMRPGRSVTVPIRRVPGW